jgi:acetate kinase
MPILVINSGSSSLKFSIFNALAGGPSLMFDGEVRGIGSSAARLKFRDAQGRDMAHGVSEIKAGCSMEALEQVVRILKRPGVPAIRSVGYRVVHPGAKLKQHTRITPDVIRELKKAAEFAPLHEPAVVEIIEEMIRRFPEAGHFACFDTVFHETMPEAASTYALPESLRAYGVRRYGFHGLSCESVVRQMRTAGVRLPRRMVIAHLGSGCSVTAVMAGRSVDTTMGLTPTGGVVMGTRPGDLDPGVMLYLLRRIEGDREAVLAEAEKMLNHDAGMVALSGLPNDMLGLREAADKGDPRAKLAIAVFTRSVRKAIGGFSWLMHGIDTIVFTGGIGENDARSRAEILDGLEDVGVRLDGMQNEEKAVSGEPVLRAIHASDSRSRIFVVPAKEDLMIAAHVESMGREG